MSDTKMPEYVAQNPFSLKYDDVNGKLASINVKQGESVFYDGVSVEVIRNKMVIRGTAPNLAGAIRLGWAVIKDESTTIPPIPSKPRPDLTKDNIPTQTPIYDGLRGGDFAAFMNPQGAKASFNKEVVNEESRTVKFTGTTDGKKFTPGDKMEVSGDHVLVKPISITTPTASANDDKPPAQARTIIRESDQDRVLPMRSVEARAEAVAAKPLKKSFVVNDQTPRLPDQATPAEVQRALNPAPLEDQGAVTVRKIRKPMEIQETEGVVVKTTVGSGSSPVSTGQQGTVVRTIKGVSPVESSPEGIKLKNSVGTAERPTEAHVTVSSGGTPVTEVTSSTARVVKKAAVSSEKAKEYIARLPENWDKMFWQQKEEFINTLEDLDFIRYIQSVETIKTVQRLCSARLQKLKAASVAAVTT